MTDHKILKSAQQGYQNPLGSYVPEKQSATAEIERQLWRLVVFPLQRPPSERHSCAEVPVRWRDVSGVRLGPVAADSPSRRIRAWWSAALRAGGKFGYITGTSKVLSAADCK
eukprot:COSAG01_NODE_5131_length_4464_cov_150.671478_4_plen_112_part_00